MEQVQMVWVPEVQVAHDGSEAAWLSEALVSLWDPPFVRVGALVPAGFESYVRIEHGPWDAYSEVAGEGSLPPHLAETLVSVLSESGSPSQRCWMAVWEGWGDMPRATPVVHRPGRNYVLVSGQLASVARPLWTREGGGTWQYTSPSVWWPEDRAWCVATEVDYTSTYLAASEAVVETVLNHPHIDARRVHVDERAT